MTVRIEHSDWTDFFKVNGEYAVRNLTVIMGMVIGSVVVVGLAMGGKLTGEIFAIYMLASGGVYGFGKWQDDKTARTRIESEAGPVPNINSTTINQPGNVNLPPPEGKA